MRPKIDLLVAGAAGRMGSRVISLAQAHPRVCLLGRLFRETPAPERKSLVEAAGAVVDFSVPAAALALARACAAARAPLVIGTTGFSKGQIKELARLSRKTPIFLAPNFSRGAAVLCALAARAAAALPDCDAAILEVHHRAKRDAPSGTALRLARAIGRAVPIVSQRIGAVIGDHTLTLAGPGERLELTHRAQSRDVFAEGALDAALWLAGRRPGLYGMDDLLGLR